MQIDFYGWVNQREATLDAAGMETSPTGEMKVQLERLDGEEPTAS